ncbi:MAG: YtxH domain-containing protein [Bacillota bacterium]|nr:YtxH domain-containing protein [Bacillota bacterium]
MLKKYFDSIESKKREQRKRERSRNRKRVFTAFTIGSLISGISALLFAPKSGKELRKDIADKTIEGAELVKKGAVTGYEKASKSLNELYANAKAAIKKENKNDVAEDNKESNTQAEE